MILYEILNVLYSFDRATIMQHETSNIGKGNVEAVSVAIPAVIRAGGDGEWCSFIISCLDILMIQSGLTDFENSTCSGVEYSDLKKIQIVEIFKRLHMQTCAKVLGTL